MQIILLLAVIILAERLTHKTALELVVIILKKVWLFVRAIFTFLIDFRMFEPRGKKS